jgi:ribose 5-phosphate isomerase A
VTAGALEQLAARALEFVPDGVIVGLGSGRAASAFVRALAGQVRAGRALRGVPASEATAALARELGVPLVGLGEGVIEVMVDGADEVDPALSLIKGYGGAMLRERIVAAASRRQVILVEVEKLVAVLGSRGRLPLEVLPFALPLALERLNRDRLRPVVRSADGRPALSDNGNVIVDCAVGPIADPAALDRALRSIPGVLDTGLFLGTAEMVLVAEDGRIRELKRPPA